MFLKFKTRELGQAAEKTAKEYLQRQGLLFVSQNFHCRLGEIDLIFKDQNTLVFVEVRYRRHKQYGDSVETINYEKQRKIIKTAQYYLQQKKLHDSMACRFDIIGITANKDQVSKMAPINWIKNAFYVE